MKTRTLTIGDIVLRGTEYLADKGVESPRLDAELLVAHVLGTTRLKLYMEWHKPLVELEIAACREAVRRRGQDREPVARIIARREFHGRDFEVAPGVFCPRPETEGLAEMVVEFVRLSTPPGTLRPTVFEVGTGSGCIAITVALECPDAHVVASDVNEKAIALAERNAARLHAGSRLTFRHGDLLAGWEGPLHAIVSNPPYVRAGEVRSLPPEVREYDPVTALDGGADGLDPLRRIVAEGARLLLPGGGIFFEIGNDQGRDARVVLEHSGAYDRIEVRHDLAGLERYATARRRG